MPTREYRVQFLKDGQQLETYVMGATKAHAILSVNELNEPDQITAVSLEMEW